MKVLGLIPARGGSKGVPGKNIKLLGGKPLLAYTAEIALQVNMFSKVVLSTDDPKIANVGKLYGMSAPFLRPQELSGDATPTLPVVQHALKYFMEQGEEFDAVCILQPTNPIRNLEDINGCISKFVEGDFDCLFSTIEIPFEHNPYWAYIEYDGGLLHLATGGTEPISRRQLLPKAYQREGSVYIIKTEVILKRNSLYGDKVGGYLIKNKFPINIDTMEDWKKAEEYFNKLK